MLSEVMNAEHVLFMTGRHINIPWEQRLCIYCLKNRNISLIDH